MGRDGEDKAPVSGYERRIENLLKRVDESKLAKDSVLFVGFDHLEDGRESVYIDVIYDSPCDENDLPDVANLYEEFATFENVSIADDLRARLTEKYGLQVLGDLRKKLTEVIHDAEGCKAEGSVRAPEGPARSSEAKDR